jgi:hypothetical protein
MKNRARHKVQACLPNPPTGGEGRVQGLKYTAQWHNGLTAQRHNGETVYGTLNPELESRTAGRNPESAANQDRNTKR